VKHLLPVLVCLLTLDLKHKNESRQAVPQVHWITGRVLVLLLTYITGAFSWFNKFGSCSGSDNK